MEEELLHDNLVIIPFEQQPATQLSATPEQPESLNLQPLHAVHRAVCHLGIGDQQSTKSSQQLALERSLSPANPQDWLRMHGNYQMTPPAQCKDHTLQ